MKSLKIKFYDKLTFDKLLSAYYRSIKNKGNREEVIKYEYNLETNLYSLIEDIRNKTYHLGKYSSFVIYEPKKRIIRKLPLRDRIVHQWYIEEFIKPYFVKRFIYDSYACLSNKGSHKAVKRVQSFMKRMYSLYGEYYILKMDISKYFNSIDKDILFKIMCKVIKDQNLIDFTRQMIYENNDEYGLPIGNYTSQFFGNIYLNELDKYIKYELKIKYYVRYLDDFIILVNSKEKSKELYKLIEVFLDIKLHLKLNPKSCYFPSRRGLDFCGYKIYEDHLLIRRRSVKKMKLNIKLYSLGYDVDIYTLFKGFYSYVKHSNCFNLISHLIKLINK